MKSFSASKFQIIIVLIIAAGFAWIVFSRFLGSGKPVAQHPETEAVPVEVAQIEHGPIELRRTFSGTLEPNAEFVISPKITGRVERLYADLGDIIKQGQIVAELDNDEYIQAVAQAEADLQVAKANLVEAKNALEIATRELNRFETLRSRGVASESQFDTASAEQLSKESRKEVAQAQVTRAEALLETARIKLGYTKISAGWTDSDSYRVVAERYVDEGETVGANAPLLSIVALNPIIGVIYVTEKDYGRLKTGQAASLVTDAYPDSRFSGEIERIAPVFGQATRQAKVELGIDNPGYRLKPGMFIRVTAVLERIEKAVIIPQQALTTRDDRVGIFVVNNHTQTVSWVEVITGITENDRVSVSGRKLSGSGLTGRVVILGQQLLSDGQKIKVTNEPASSDTGMKEMTIQ